MRRQSGKFREEVKGVVEKVLGTRVLKKLKMSDGYQWFRSDGYRWFRRFLERQPVLALQNGDATATDGLIKETLFQYFEMSTIHHPESLPKHHGLHTTNFHHSNLYKAMPSYTCLSDWTSYNTKTIFKMHFKVFSADCSICYTK